MAAATSAPEQTTADAPALSPRDEAVAMLRAVQSEAEASETAGEKDEASAPPDAPSSPAVSEEKKEPDERVSKRIATATKIEQRAAKMREEQNAREAKLNEREQALEAKFKELESKFETYKLLEQDPVKAFEALKIDPKGFLERLAGEHDPNKVIEREIAKEREARIALEKKLEEERAAREKAAQEAQRAAWEAQQRAAEKEATSSFISMLESNADKYPHLADEFTPEEIAAKAWQVAVEHSEAYKNQFGEYPDDSVIADYLEAEAAKRAEARNAWRSRLKKTSEPGQGTASAGKDPALKPRTLTNGSASTRASAQKPWDEKTAREDAIKIIRQLHEASSDS